MARSSQCDMAMANQKQKETAKRICRTRIATFNYAIDNDDDNDNHIGLLGVSSPWHMVRFSNTNVVLVFILCFELLLLLSVKIRHSAVIGTCSTLPNDHDHNHTNRIPSSSKRIRAESVSISTAACHSCNHILCLHRVSSMHRLSCQSATVRPLPYQNEYTQSNTFLFITNTYASLSLSPFF